MTNAIEVKHVTMRFKGNDALRDVQVRFEEGKIYGLLGRNGAGKTTLLNIINNRLFPTEGAVYINGEAAKENDRVLSDVYFLSDVQLIPEETKVKEMFKITKTFYPGFDMDYALRLCSVYQLDVRKKLRALSTGYKAIAKLVCALATDARYLLLDEPVLGLDANHRDQFYRDLLESYNARPRTIILSTHLIEEVASIIEQVVIIKDGTILLDQPAEEVRKMGYSIAGKAEDVERYCAGKNVLRVTALGGLKTACIFGEFEQTDENLQYAELDLQQLFIHLTNQ